MFPNQRLLFLTLMRSPRPRSAGFTLIELLVVVMIAGVLAAIALPSYLSQANKARQTEAKTYVGTINRGQQVYFLEHSAFGTLADLEINIPPSTGLYNYASAPEVGSVAAHTTATPRFTSTAAYSGRVWIISASGSTTSVLCENLSGTPPMIVGATCP